MSKNHSNFQLPKLSVLIEIPRGSFTKRGWNGRIDFISPLPCPYNYGSIPNYIGGDGDLLDAVVIGPRLKRGIIVDVFAHGAIGFIDQGIYEYKLICSNNGLGAWDRMFVVIFFHIYAKSKRLLNLYRGKMGRTQCDGWKSAESAIARAQSWITDPKSNENLPGLTR
jgi:inorganic pyrophosphatase